MQEEVFEPLGLKNTSLKPVDLTAPGLLHGYATIRGERVDVTDNTAWAGNPAGGATSTVEDVNIFMAALFTGRAISSASLREMKASPGFAPYGPGIWEHSDGCSKESRHEGLGSLWGHQTTAVSSADGRYQATMTVTVPPLPTGLEDPASEEKRSFMNGRMESTLNETLDRLCKAAR